MVNTNILKSKIVGAGMTQRDLAKALGVSVKTLSAKINGKSAFSTKEVVKTCDILQISDSNEKVFIFLT